MTTSQMWDQIKRIPLQDLDDSPEFVYVEKVLSLAKNYYFTADDENLKDPENAAKVGNLLRVVSTKCDRQLKTLEDEIEKISNAKKASENSLRRKNELLREELLRVSNQAVPPELVAERSAAYKPEPPLPEGDATELERLRKECDTLAYELLKSTRKHNDLAEMYASRDKENAELTENLNKFELEYKHLVSRYSTLSETYKRDNDQLRTKLEKENKLRIEKQEEVERLKQSLVSLRAANSDLIVSRDHAEEELEKRGVQMENDLKKVMYESEKMMNTLSAKIDSLTLTIAEQTEEIARQEDTIRERDEQIKVLESQLESGTHTKKSARTFGADSSSTPTDSHSDLDSDSADKTLRDAAAPLSSNEQTEKLLITQRRLERENDDLMAEIERLENRCDALQTENKRLTNVMRTYEKDNKGLAHLNRQLSEMTQQVDGLNKEKAQLRERLNATEDSLAFTAALQELCRRMGVTEEEINSLRPKKSAVYSEIDTLREEINVLKDEVEWLEKERRHWMNRVRLQPLMDTKLRFELGLSSEQLKQLDKLVDEMKAGRVVVDDNDASYREKYLKELEMRKRDAALFDDQIKERIENTLKTIIASVNTPEGQQVAGTLQQQLSYLNQNRAAEVGGENAAAAHAAAAAVSEEQLNSLRTKVAELEMSAKADKEELTRLRGEQIRLTATNELLSKERDQYREAIFQSAGVAVVTGEEGEGDAAHGGPAGGAPTRGRGAAAEAKWASLSSAFHEQMALKDTVIESLTAQVNDFQESLRDAKRTIEATEQKLLVERRNVESLQDQLSALNEGREELLTRVEEQQKVNDDLLHAQREHNNHELLQKVVLLRKRESTLLDRLRRTTSLLHEAKAFEKERAVSTERLLQEVKDILSGATDNGPSGGGFIVPSSNYQREAEEQMLLFFQQRCSDVVKGRLFKEDWEYVNRMRQVHAAMEESQELADLRNRTVELKRANEALQAQLDEAAVQHEGAGAAAAGGASAAKSSEGQAVGGTTAEWESEALVWRQKYELCLKRFRDKEEEVKLLEGNLEAVQREVAGFREQLRQVAGGSAGAVDPAEGAAAATGADGNNGEKDGSAAPSATPQPTRSTRALEKDLARMKSANLSLVQHSLELQGRVKSLEIDLDAKHKELSLIKDSGDAKVISDFVTAAIKEHASLRRQCELASLHSKRLRVQLAATEANFHVVANEATSYKLGAYRLFRKFVDEMVVVVDVLRRLQRADRAAPSPHRVELMDKLYHRALRDLEAQQERNKVVTLQNAQLQSTVHTLSQKLDLASTPPPDVGEWASRQLTELNTKLRDAAHAAAEMTEDRAYQDSKVRRLENTIRLLNEEVARQEAAGTYARSLLSEDTLAVLMQLKDTVFARAAAAPVAIEGVPKPGGAGDAYGATDEALREYKEAVARTVELSRRCVRLTRELEDKDVELRKQRALVGELNEETARLGDHVKYNLAQLEQERSKSEEREARLIKAHEAQAAVARRANEHNQKCLQDLIRKKDEALQHLQEQLLAERQKYTSQQFDEATRLERLHETMFRENTLMVERFRVAIDEVGNSFAQLGGEKPDAASQQQQQQQRPSPASLADGQAASAQLEALTSELVSLRSELKNLKATNIVLEAQLAQQISDAERTLPVVLRTTAAAPTFAGGGGGGAAGGPPNATTTTTTNTTTTVTVPGAAGPAPSQAQLSAGTETLVSIVHSQSAVMESMRQREVALTESLRKERERCAALEARLEEVGLAHVEQTGALRLASAVARAGEPADVQELRAQLAATEAELTAARQQLQAERHNAHRLETDVGEWRTQFEQLRGDVRAQQQREDRVRLLESMNEGLQQDLATLRRQNDKLVLAATVLRQKLVDEAARGGEAERKGQQEAALTQRMAAIQREADDNIRSLEKRIRAVQKELSAQAASEKAVVSKTEESQRLALQLHQQLQAKNTEILALKQQLQDATRAPHTQKATGASAAAATATAAAPAGPDAVQTAAMVRREAQRMQRDNLQQISQLRGAQAQAERELAEAREGLRAEREITHQLRVQLNQARQRAADAGTGSRSVVPIPHAVEAELEKVRQQLAKTSAAFERVLGDLARERGVSAESLTWQYRDVGVASAFQARAAELEQELLKKSNTIVDLNFTIESLRLRVRKLEEAARLQGGGGGGGGGAAGTDPVAASAAENLKVVVAQLQRENRELREAAGRAGASPDLLREVNALRAENRSLTQQVEWYARRPSSARGTAPVGRAIRYSDASTAGGSGVAAPSGPSSAFHQHGHLDYQRPPTQPPTQPPADDAGVPAPLPAAAQRYRTAAAAAEGSAGGGGHGLQRRLSARDSATAGHQFLHHHDLLL